MNFEIISELTETETIAVGRTIRDVARLRRKFGPGRWRKLKGASLELHKIYRILPDPDAAVDGDIRVVDESGEDYLYPEEYFVFVELPRAVEKSLLRAA